MKKDQPENIETSQPQQFDPICLRKMGCNCVDCAAAFNSTSKIDKPTGIKEDLIKQGWLESQLEAMLKPEAALGHIAMPFAKVLNSLKSFAESDESSRHLLCSKIIEGNNMLKLLQLCIGASDYLRWLALEVLVSAAGCAGMYGQGEAFRNLSDKVHAEFIDL